MKDGYYRRKQDICIFLGKVKTNYLEALSWMR